MLQALKMKTFLKQICFGKKATFYVSGKLDKHNVSIWGSEHLHMIKELQRDSPKVNVWYGVMCNQIIGPFFFFKATITADVYLDLLTEYAAP